MTKIQLHATRVGWVGFIVLLAIASLALLNSCGRPNQPPPPQSEPITAVPIDTSRSTGEPDREFVRINSDNPDENGPSRQIAPGPQAGAQKGFLGRLFGGKSASKPSKTHNLAGAQPGPRKCKGCTFNIVAGDQTNVGKKATAATAEGATASVTGKKSGPAIVASDSSVLNAVTGGGNLAAVRGNGNTLDQTSTTQEAADWRAVLAKPAGQVGAAVLGLVLVGGAVYLVILWRKKKAAQNLV